MSDFALREMQPDDSAALVALVQANSNNQSGGMTTIFQMDAYRVLIEADLHRTIGVVAETRDFQGLAGVGIVTFSEVMFEEQLRPCAFLSSLKVHPDFRRRGLGWQLAKWRVERAREELGPDVVIVTGMLTSNAASRATASKWANEFFEPVKVMIAIPFGEPPAPLPGITVRRAADDEIAQIVDQQNAFYQQANLYEPQNTASLSGWLRYSLIDTPIHEYMIAVTDGGDILAGAAVTARHKLMMDRIEDPPPSMRAALPPDLTLRECQVKDLWYSPGQISAAQHLWASLPWIYQESVNNITAAYDLLGPLADVFPPPPDFLPHIEIALAIHRPVSMTNARFVTVPGRR